MIISSAGIFWSASAITENTKKYARIPATQNGSEMYMADPENNEGRFCCLSKGAEAAEPLFLCKAACRFRRDSVRTAAEIFF